MPGGFSSGRAGQHEDRAADFAQVLEHVLFSTALEDPGLVLGIAAQLDRAVRPVDEAVVDVGLQCARV